MVENPDAQISRLKTSARIEILLNRNKEPRAVFKTTQRLLQERLSVDIDLSTTRFVSQEELERQDRMQAAQSNKIAKAIVENSLPMPYVSQLSIANGAIVETDSGTQAYLRAKDFVGMEFFGNALDQRARESSSAVSVGMFNNLTRLAVEHSTPIFQIDTDRKVLKWISGLFVATVRQATVDNSEQDVSDFKRYVEGIARDIKNLSIDIKGAKVRLLHEDIPLIEYPDDLNRALLRLIADSLEEEFAARMEQKCPWFIPPARFQTGIISNQFKLSNYDQATAEFRSNFPGINIPDELDEMIRMFKEGDFAMALLRESASKFGVTRVEKKNTESLKVEEVTIFEEEIPTTEEEIPKPKKEKRKKNPKNQKPTNQSIQTFSKKPKKVRQAEAKPQILAVPIKFDPKEEVVIETREQRRLRRKAEEAEKIEARKRDAIRQSRSDQAIPRYQIEAFRAGEKIPQTGSIGERVESDVDSTTEYREALDISDIVNSILLDLNKGKKSGVRFKREDK